MCQVNIKYKLNYVFINIISEIGTYVKDIFSNVETLDPAIQEST